MDKKKEQRSNKWAFIFYKDSAPADYLRVLDDYDPRGINNQ